MAVDCGVRDGGVMAGGGIAQLFPIDRNIYELKRWCLDILGVP